MVALPPVPEVLRIGFTFTDGSATDIQSRFFLGYSGTAPTDAQLNTLAGVVRAEIASGFAVYYVNAITLVQTEIIDLSSATGAVGIDTTQVVGTRTGGGLPAGVAALINFKVARRYRGGKPRIYLPFGSETDIHTPQQWQASFVTDLGGSWPLLISAITAAPWSGATLGPQVNVSYYEGVYPPVTLPSGRTKQASKPRVAPLVDAVTGSSMNPFYSSQRRRNRA